MDQSDQSIEWVCDMWEDANKWDTAGDWRDIAYALNGAALACIWHADAEIADQFSFLGKVARQRIQMS